MHRPSTVHRLTTLQLPCHSHEHLANGLHELAAQADPSAASLQTHLTRLALDRFGRFVSLKVTTVGADSGQPEVSQASLAAHNPMARPRERIGNLYRHGAWSASNMMYGPERSATTLQRVGGIDTANVLAQADCVLPGLADGLLDRPPNPDELGATLRQVGHNLVQRYRATTQQRDQYDLVVPKISNRSLEDSPHYLGLTTITAQQRLIGAEVTLRSQVTNGDTSVTKTFSYTYAARGRTDRTEPPYAAHLMLSGPRQACEAIGDRAPHAEPSADWLLTWTMDLLSRHLTRPS